MSLLTPRKWLGWNLLLVAILVVVVVAATAVGERSFSVFTPWGALSPEEKDILFVSRLPRVLLAAVCGIALGASGTAFQGLLRNALADPYILGASSGAALGSILGLALRLPFGVIPMVAFATSLTAMIVVYKIASLRGRLSPDTLLLTGVILNAFLFAFILILNGLVSFEQSQKILYLLIGSLDSEEYGRILLVGGLVLVGLALLTLEGQPLNLLTAGTDSARTLGIEPYKHRRRIFFAASLMVGAVVPLAGLIGFVGLFVPHIARRIVGPDHRLTIPASGWIGAILLIVCDTLARTLLVSTRFQTELPVGAITALVGAPFFLFLLKRRPS